MVMQINRTPTPNNPPASGALAQGQLSVGMADTPNPTLWVGVPTTIDPTGRRLVNGPGALFSATAAGTVPMTGAATASAVLTAAGTWTVPAVYTTTVNGVVPAPTAAAPAAAMLTAAGTWALPQIKVTTQVFTSSGTYTPPAGLQCAVVECIGAGGAGGAAVVGPTVYVAAGGGGSGGYSRSVLSAAQIGASQTVTVAAGGVSIWGTPAPVGDSSFGTLVIARGGENAKANDNSGIVGSIGELGRGAPVGTGQVAVAGNPGEMWSASFGAFICSGGGGSLWGSAGAQFASINGVAQPGITATGPGGGGGGACGNAAGASVALDGGSGGSGLVIVTEYSF